MRQLVLFLALFATPAQAGGPVVEAVTAAPAGGGWTFNVTVSHGDTGWDHYADGWSVFAPDGEELGHRKLLHPHVEEQPFTRSLSGVYVPPDLPHVVIRARDSVHGWGEGIELEWPAGDAPRSVARQ